jgi:DNA-binding response OmpR family regulator
MHEDNTGQGVLLVDDNRDLRRLVMRLLERLGYVVHEASTAATAFSITARERPALVLLDVHLPDISGYEVCRRLRDDFGNDVYIVKPGSR